MRYPHYLQRESKDCAPTCLRMVAKFYGKSVPLSYLREVSYTQRTGTTMLGLSQGAETIGIDTLCVNLTWEQFSAGLPLPCIIHWDNDHFVVVYEIKGDKIIVGDPAYGIVKYNKELFLKCWLQQNNETDCAMGTVLLLEPTKKFHDFNDNIREEKPSFRYLFNYIKRYRVFLFQLILSLGLATVISLIFPFLTQSIVDIGIDNKDLNFIIIILFAQVLLVVGQNANTFIRTWVMVHMTMRLDISLISDFLNKLMRLPISFFDNKLIGDITERIGDFSRVQNFLLNSVLGMFISLVTFMVYGGIMVNYDLGIMGVFLGGSFIYVLWMMLFMRRRRKLEYIRFQETSVEQSNMVQLISGMQEIKLNSCEAQKRWDWERIQVKLYNVGMKDLSLKQVQEAGAIFINQTQNVIISFLAARAVVTGEITLGMMMAIQYIIGQLNAPVGQFIGFMQSLQSAQIGLERINEIQGKQDEEPKEKKKIQDIPIDKDLELKNVTFHYNGPRSLKVLDNVNLTVEHGKVTAVVGASGSGKTTLLKLLLGFYAPTSGDISLGGIALNEYSESEWRRSCGVVMQEGFIFYDTVANNIALIDKKPNMKKVREATKMSCADDFINTLPLGINTKVGLDGRGISTGQKQRLLIARAIYKNAPYLILDEATNSLDANNEMKIIKNLDLFCQGKTSLIVAHRLSTVKNADKIIVLNKGKIVEEGTHVELTALKGYYYNLVKNQLELGA